MSEHSKIACVWPSVLRKVITTALADWLRSRTAASYTRDGADGEADHG